jgi:hypothetical protein
MKFWFKSTLSIFLCAMILVTGSGVSLAKMVCVKSGYTSITINVPDDCCKHEHPHAPVTLEEKCCDISGMHVDILQYVVSATQNIQKSFVAIEVPSLSSDLDYAQSDNIASHSSSVFRDQPKSSFPPIRILTRTFLI